MPSFVSVSIQMNGKMDEIRYIPKSQYMLSRREVLEKQVHDPYNYLHFR